MEIFLVIFIGLCLIAACTDFLLYRIPNWVVLFLLITYSVRAMLLLYMGLPIHTFYVPMLSLIIVFLAGFALFNFKVLGAGDAKLLAVTALWMGEVNIFQFIMLTLISGGILAIIYLKFKKSVDFLRNLLLAKIINKNGATVASVITTNAVPYAIAITGGVLWALALNGWKI